MSAKKGGAKGTAATKEVRQYVANETVLGKIRGYPPWPGIILDAKDIPDHVANDAGRKPAFHCVQFFPAGDYGWLHPKDLSSLRPSEIDAYLADDTKKRNGDLHQGYSIARDPSSWLVKNKAERERARALADSLAGSEDDEDDGEGADEDGNEDADGDADGEGEVDELDSESNGVDGGKEGRGKKRKRVSGAGDAEDGAPKKKKATGSKAAKSPKESASAVKEKKEKKPRASKAKSKAVVESEDDADGDAEADMDVDEEAGTSKKGGRKSVGGAKEKKEKAAKEPKEKKAPKEKEAKAPKEKKEAAGGEKKEAGAKKEKAGKEDEDGDDAKASSDPQSLKVRDWRHKLQKTFLSQKAVPKPEAMQEVDALFTTVESYEGMTIEQLQFSKIGKVMRHIAAIPDANAPPLDADYRFRARAKGLVDRWHQILNANKPAGVSPESKKETSPGKKSASPAKKDVDAQAEADVIKATNGIDLNGNEHDPSPAAAIAAAYTAQAEGEADAAAELDADASLGDITMS